MPPPLIIGSGLAGLSAALTLAPQPVTVLARRATGTWTSSAWAQGGIAAAVGGDDNPELHAADTLAAGAGLCDPAIVRLVTGAGPDAIEQLEQWGVAFDRAADGQRQLSLEGAHSRRRVVHAQGDSTGAAIMQALVARAKDTPSITFIEDAEATDLLTRDGIVVGVRYRDSSGAFHDVATRQVVLATGGVGALWQHTTNPLGSWGQGLALAARCGAA